LLNPNLASLRGGGLCLDVELRRVRQHRVAPTHDHRLLVTVGGDDRVLAVGRDFMPGGGSAGEAEDVGVATAAPQAASAEPVPTASTAMPPACSTDRRGTAFAMSPKYSLSLVFGAGLEQASPHL
jgi:hypothetical protein